MALPGVAKTKQADRRADGERLTGWCDEVGVVLERDLRNQLEAGFGPSKSGEDPFDAVVGLFGMINDIRRGREPDLPDDPAVLRLEGSMFGQLASEASGFVARTFIYAPKAMKKLP